MEPYRQEDIDSVSTTIGKIVLLWGTVESSLNGLALVLIHPLNNPSRHKGVPTQFSALIELLKRCYEENQRMASVCDEATDLLDRLAPLHERRSIIVHGNYQGMGPDNRHIFVIYRSGRAQRHAWQWKQFTAGELSDLAETITAVEIEVQKLVTATHKLSAQQAD